ncbi:hypothetical protein H310_14375 [Aphanomyces invadans]|uniref:Uncharacterized protein n=1 Tax=Aphanomyces invadans TaxID=157072 RepID=A0A024TA57_9STRA|nr:hypothetical protein H310_14375 [Aphanomyces invadans]ETV90879.1 hypothetical protein H310_14375 [Aphanomyces invadans]|eukprot:XP_008880444.1 hypothetical protein H310_14375 [Aphanomyces invadans]
MECMPRKHRVSGAASEVCYKLQVFASTDTITSLSPPSVPRTDIARHGRSYFCGGVVLDLHRIKWSPPPHPRRGHRAHRMRERRHANPQETLKTHIRLSIQISSAGPAPTRSIPHRVWSKAPWGLASSTEL